MANLLDLALFVHQSVAAVCPIEGVSIQDENDPSTWRISFSAAATPIERRAAQDFVATFDVKGAIPPRQKNKLERFQELIETKSDLLAKLELL